MHQILWEGRPGETRANLECDPRQLDCLHKNSKVVIQFLSVGTALSSMPAAALSLSLCFFLGTVFVCGIGEQCIGLATQWSVVQFLVRAWLHNDSGQIVHTHVPLSPSSII